MLERVTIVASNVIDRAGLLKKSSVTHRAGECYSTKGLNEITQSFQELR
jgi:hypothetical protein